MTDADQVLALLYDRAEAFFPLDELASVAGVSWAQVESAVVELTRRGQHVERSPAHGLRLTRPIAMDSHLLERGLSTRRIGRSILCFPEVDSTNDVALAAIPQGGTDGLVVTAECQRCGRGRQGRPWLSRPGANVLLSTVLLDSAGAPPQESMTIAAGLAVAEAIAETCGLECELKWPNDVMLDGRKVAGVLVERRSGANACVVVGIGANANRAPADDEVDRPATCLAAVAGHPIDRIPLVRALLGRLDERVARLCDEAFEELHTSWLARCGMVNERVAAVCAGRRYEGRVLDVSPLEGLILSCDDGTCVHLAAERTSMVE